MSDDAPKDTRAMRRELFARIRRSIVAIGVHPPGPEGGVLIEPAGRRHDFLILGTGFVIAPGIVLTALHVLNPWINAAPGQRPPSNPRLMIPEIGSVDGKMVQGFHSAKVVGLGANTNTDIAVLRIDPNDPFTCAIPPLALDPNRCCEGDIIGMCGFPLGNGLHRSDFGEDGRFISSFSQGLVSAILPHPDAPLESQRIFQIDAMVNPGNSGGPVFNQDTGEVCGVLIEKVMAQRFIGVRVADMQGGDPEKDKFADVQVPAGLARAHHVAVVGNLVEGLIEYAEKHPLPNPPTA
jgi:S1-C subfamily serine protease